MSFFGKYDGLPGRPDGRPVGVRNGQGARPNVPANPMLKGLQHTQTPLSTSVDPAIMRQKAIAPGPPALAPGTTETLLGWATKNLGGR